MYKRYYHNANYSALASVKAQFISDLNDALEYAGLTGLYAKIVDNDYGSFGYVFIGTSEDTPDSTNSLAYVKFDSGAMNVYCAGDTIGTNISFAAYNSIIATADAVAILGGSSDMNSTTGFIITKDTNSKYVTIFPYVDNNTPKFDTPRMVVHDVSTQVQRLNITPVSTFGTTTLVNFPTENLSQEGYYVDNVFMGVTVTLSGDGECVLNDNHYYTVGGKIYMVDVPAE